MASFYCQDHFVDFLSCIPYSNFLFYSEESSLKNDPKYHLSHKRSQSCSSITTAVLVEKCAPAITIYSSMPQLSFLNRKQGDAAVCFLLIVCSLIAQASGLVQIDTLPSTLST